MGGTIVGIWDKSTGLLGATGRDQVMSLVTLYGPRTTVFMTLDDGVYEFTLGPGNQWICSRDKIQIKQDCKIFAPANMRAAQEVEGYSKLIDHYMTSKYTLRLVEMAGGKTSDGVTGKSVLDVKIEAVDQRTALAIGSANEVDRFNETVLNLVSA